MACEESGVNPLARDAEGFRRRCERRIRQGRVWVAVEAGRLLFKADIVSDTPAVLYLEGIYVAPEVRGNGFGLHCLTQMCRSLLARTGSLGLLVNEENRRAVKLYERAGFRLRDFYHTIFLQQEN
jgi:predicted GNAT family acetyltransferase